jgi:hypothetical protein
MNEKIIQTNTASFAYYQTKSAFGDRQGFTSCRKEGKTRKGAKMKEQTDISGLILTFIALLALFFGLCFVAGCVNPGAQRFTEFAIGDCVDLIQKNPNFNEQEKRLYMVMLHLALEFEDADIDAINQIYRKEKKFVTPAILEIYKKYGVELRYEKAQTQTKGE